MKTAFSENNIGTVQTNISENILLVQICRPQKRNALCDGTVKRLEEIFSNIPDAVSCAILYGEGEHFSAGLDLSELGERSAIDGFHHSRFWHRVMNALQYGKVPIVAVLKGACLGGGLELASACHIRVAEKNTFYALPEGQRGIFVGGGGSVRLPKLIGMARMTDMMLTGRVYDAAEGVSIGLSQYLVEEGEGFAKAMELAKKIGSNASMTNYALMHILPHITESRQEQGLVMESLISAIAQSTPEAKQRMQNFLKGKAEKIQKDDSQKRL